MAGPSVADDYHHDVVEIRVPASGAYLAVLRTAAAGLAARLNFTVDEIEDLRIAVDEACALLLPVADADTQLRCAITVEDAALRVSVSTTAPGAPEPRRDTFAWTVLTALAGEVDATVDGDGLLTVSLRKQRQLTGAS